jgi:trimethylamine--corrinoid protein Co-methyltransferase
MSKFMQKRVASVQPIKSALKLKILDDSDIRAIDETALRILEEIGVYMPLERALKIYADAGANVDFDHQIVKIPADLVKKSMAQAPRSFVLAGRDRPELDLKIDGLTGTYFSCGGGASSTIDMITREKRFSVKADTSNQAKIADYLPYISLFYPTTSASDYRSTLHEMEAALNNTEKHVAAETVVGETESKYLLEMAAVIAGGKEALRKRPFLSAVICVVSPLAFVKDALESIIVYAEAGIPINIQPMPTMTMTAAASQAGALAQGLAEVLSGIVLIQLVNPGNPSIASILPAVIDPRTGDYHYSGPFSEVTNAAGIQLAHYYNIPSHSGASLGGSSFELNKWQVGRENVYLPLLAVMVGAELSYSMGLIEAVNLYHPPRIIFDGEIHRHVDIMSQGIEVNDMTLAFETIREVGPRGTFLDKKHTAENVRKFWPDSILFQKSVEPGKRYKDPTEAAWDQIHWILENHHVPSLEPKMQSEMKKTIEAAEKEINAK